MPQQQEIAQPQMLGPQGHTAVGWESGEAGPVLFLVLVLLLSTMAGRDHILLLIPPHPQTPDTFQGPAPLAAHGVCSHLCPKLVFSSGSLKSL